MLLPATLSVRWYQALPLQPHSSSATPSTAALPNRRRNGIVPPRSGWVSPRSADPTRRGAADHGGDWLGHDVPSAGCVSLQQPGSGRTARRDEEWIWPPANL